VLNAENMAWIEALDAAVGEIATTDAVRVVVLRVVVGLSARGLISRC